MLCWFCSYFFALMEQLRCCLIHILMDPCIIAGRSIDRAMLPVAVYEVSGGGVVGMLVVAELVMVSCALHVCTL
jgi:hypothetical protein